MIPKKILSAFMVVAFIFTMVLGTIPMAYASKSAALPDIEGHWAQSTIQDMVNEGIIGGYPDGTFKPNNNITRAEFASLIVRAFDLESSPGKTFKDTTDHWAKDAIKTANYYGLVKGYSDALFGPDDPVTREQVAAMIINATKAESTDISKVFTDSTRIAAWAKDSVTKATAAGLLAGYPDGTFKPKEKATRAEAAVILDKGRKLTIEEAITKYDSAGTYGPESGTQTIAGDVTISADGVILRNSIIKGNLAILEEVGGGDVTLNNVTVKGTTFIRGGGKDSIHINGGQYNDIIIESTPDGNVRLVATNAEGIQVIISEKAAGEEIILQGTFESVAINADNVVLSTRGETGIINEIKVHGNLSGTAINIDKNTTVKELVLDSVTKVNNAKDTVESISGKELSNSTIANPPEEKAPVGGGGGGDSGSSTVKVSAISVTTNIDVTGGVANNATVTVTLATTTAGASIYYTLNGDTPTASSTLYSAPFEVKTTNPAGETITVKAIGIKSGYTNSAVATKEIVFKAEEVVEPVTYTVTFRVTPEGATIVVKDSESVEIVAEEDETYKLKNGTYSYTISKTGYVEKTGNITVSDCNHTMNISLQALINIAEIVGVTAPVRDAAPVTMITETDQYTGTVSWSPAVVGDKFAASTVYTATITLTPKSGYTLTGVAENFFSVAGATATNDANSGVVTAVFPATAAPAPVLQSIEVTTPPTKTTYLVGEKLNLTGLVVTGTYSDGNTAVIEITADMVSGFDSSAAVVEQVVTITVEGKTATFNVTIVADEPVFTLTMVSDPETGGSCTGGGAYTEGTQVSLTATESAGYVFKNWTIEDEVISEENEFTYTMPKNNVTITANFSKLYTLYTGADPGGAGTVTEQGQYPEGAVITLDYTENIGYLFSHWKVDGVDYSADDTLEYVMPDSDSTVIAKFRPIADINVWDGTVASSMFRLSDGTYLIRTGSELAWIAEQTNPLSNPDCTNFKGVKFKLVCNLDLDNRPWTPIGLDRCSSNTGWFSGIFQGGNKTIKNLKVDVGGAGAIGGMDDDTPADVIIAGLFGQLGPTAKITGLKLQRVNITAKASGNNIVGGIAGYNYGIISKCSVGGNIVLNTPTSNNCAGGIVGLNRSTGTVEKSFSTARVTITKGGAKAGGIIGLNGGTIEKCFNDGRVTSSEIAGGIVADNFGGVVKDCFNANVITLKGTAENDYAGGIIGVNGGNISTCYSTGKISAISGISGGVIGGNFQSTTKHCYYLAGTAPAGVGKSSGSTGTATPLNEVQIQDRMHVADNFVGFDFMKVWYFKEDYPPPHLLEFKKPPAGECELELEVEPEDAGTVTGGGRYLSGIKVEISATPKAGGEFIFKNWTVGGVPISSKQTYEYRMPKDDVTVTANFEVKPKPHYTLTVTAEEGGTVTGGGSYEAGQDVSLSAEAHEGYEFEKWMIDSKTIGTDASMTYTMPEADTTIVGVFKLIELPAEPDKYKLTLCVEPEEGGTVTGGGSYEADEVVTITAEAYDGYKFEKWTIDGKTISTDAGMTYTMPAGDIAITAHFIERDPDLYLLTLNTNLPGAGTVTGAGKYPGGEEVLLSAVPNEGYKFISWTDYGSTLGSEAELAYTMPDWNVEITANFKPVCSGGGKCLFQETGTLEDPIQIRTRELLEHINEHIEQTGLHYKLMNSISLSGADWTPIGITLEEEGYAIGDYDEFSGCFDGNGHTISNMTVNFTQFEMAYGGLFGYIVEGEVKDLILKDVDITINAYMGHEGGGGSAYAGGIAGAADSTVIENCSVSGEIRISPEAWLGYPTLGGIAGACRDGIIRGCSNYANVTAQSGNTGNEAGGIVGVSSGNSIITGCLNEGIITTDQAWGKMYTSNFSGGIAGGNYGDIVSCYNKGEVYAKRGYISRNAGGVAGYSYGNVLACYNTGSVEASAVNRDNLTRAGGLIGSNHGEVCASYSVAKVSAIGGTKSQGGVAGANDSPGTIKDCAYLRSIDGIPYEAVGTGGLGTGGSAGGLARGIMPEGFSSIKYCPYCGATGVSPLSCLDDTHESVEIRAWLISGLSYPKLSAFYTYIPPTCGCHDSLGAFYSGNGTENNPYKIYTEHQLHHISAHCAEGDVIHYRLEDDIDVEEPWIPIGSESKPFNGVLDGNGHVVRNFTMNRTADDQLHIGLFGVTSESSKIYNLRLENVDIQFTAENKPGQYYVGAFAGKNKGLIEGCSVSGLLSASVTDMLTGVGSIAGQNEGSITRCYNSSTIEINSHGESGGSDGGGIVADNCSIIEDCYNTGEILLSGGVENRAAGIAALNLGAEVRRCYNIGTITVGGASNANEGAGIVVNNADGTLAYCYNNADTSNQTIVVPEIGTVENCSMLTDEQMKDVNRWSDYFAGFEWESVWGHGTSGYPYPQLKNNAHVMD